MSKDLERKVVQDFSTVEELLNQGWRLYSSYNTEYQSHYFLEKPIEHEPPIQPH